MKAEKADKKSTKVRKEVAGSSLAADKKKQLKKKGKDVPEKKEREKKVFELPGQKYEAPDERDPLRIFYETLREQRPDSEMAEAWMMEHGLLNHDEAKVALGRKQKRAEQTRKGGPGAGLLPPKSSPPSSNNKKTPVAASSNGKAKVKKRGDDEDDDFDSGSKKKKMKR